MALQTIEQSEEQTQKDNARQKEASNSVKDAIVKNPLTKEFLKDLGLQPEAEEQKENKAQPKKQEKQKEVEEEVQEEEVEEEQEATDDEDSDEEVIPKSKVQSRFDKLSSTIKALQNELDELRSAKTTESKDPITKQLEEMTPEQLRATRREIDKNIIKHKDDDAKIDELLDIRDKVDDIIKEAPARFAKQQTVEFNKMATRLEQTMELSADDAKKIIKIASDIYNQNPIFQKDVKGQATALKMAAEHFKELSRFSAQPVDKSKESELKRQNNNLKRKTLLDTKTSKGNVDTANLDRLKKAAIGGTMKQKLELIKTHPGFNIAGMIPDEYKS